jgi:glycosyltransferase involved in cell wall biosynthesis
LITTFTTYTTLQLYQLPNKVLIITYYWPPSGGAGVQRWLKFAKYLPEYGWEPIILTVDPAYAAYPVIDSSLNENLPESVKVFATPATDYFSIYKKDKSKIPTAGFANNSDSSFKGKILRFIRGNFFIPDPRRGWNKFALKKACEIIESENVNHIITTSPPHSTQLIGLKIKKRYPGIKWIADLRDPWTDIYYYDMFYPTFISKMIDSQLEKSVLRNTDRIITVGSSLKDSYSLKVREVGNKTAVITNGYDETDFKDISITNPPVFRITYVGTLTEAYPVIGLISSLKSLRLQGKDFVLRFVGTVPENTKGLILSHIPETSAEFLSYVSHSEAIKYMMDSTVLILIIPLHKSNKTILTGKLFEYLASMKPILCLGPIDGDAAEIIIKCTAGITVDYNDEEKILEFLLNIETHSGLGDKNAIRELSRQNLTKQLAAVLK